MLPTPKPSTASMREDLEGKATKDPASESAGRTNASYASHEPKPLPAARGSEGRPEPAVVLRGSLLDDTEVDGESTMTFSKRPSQPTQSSAPPVGQAPPAPAPPRAPAPRAIASVPPPPPRRSNPPPSMRQPASIPPPPPVFTSVPPSRRASDRPGPGKKKSSGGLLPLIGIAVMALALAAYGLYIGFHAAN